MDADRNFTLQQGLDLARTCYRPEVAAALRFQPWIVGVWAAAGALLHSASVLAALAAVLAWSALVPRWNPFDLVHNALLAARAGRPRLEPAPAPRRFSAFLASLFAAGSAVCLSQGAPTAALVLEAILLLAVVLIVSVRFCLGSFVYHTIRGRLRFAIRTLPWGPGEEPSPTSPSGD
jgi:hypothetical protein